MLPQAWSHNNSTSAEYNSPSSAPSYPYPNPKGSELYRLPAPPPRVSRWIARTLAYTIISANSARQPSLNGRHSEGSWQPCVKVSRCAKTPSAARRKTVENIPKCREVLHASGSLWTLLWCFTGGKSFFFYLMLNVPSSIQAAKIEFKMRTNKLRFKELNTCDCYLDVWGCSIWPQCENMSGSPSSHFIHKTRLQCFCPLTHFADVQIFSVKSSCRNFCSSNLLLCSQQQLRPRLSAVSDKLHLSARQVRSSTDGMLRHLSFHVRLWRAKVLSKQIHLINVKMLKLATLLV